MAVSAEAEARLFAGADGAYRFAGWGRPLVPVLFGAEDDRVAVFRAALQVVSALTRHGMADPDPEMAANLMVFGVRDGADVGDVPAIGGLVPGIGCTLARLEAAGANQYRLFRFEAGGAIRAVFLFLRMDAALVALPVADLALEQAVRLVLLSGDAAFAGSSPLGRLDGVAGLRFGIAALIRAGYDPVLPDVARDASHAVRLAARMPVDVVFP